MNCMSCNGSGKCSVCGGSPMITCGTCHGSRNVSCSPRVTCSACNGSKQANCGSCTNGQKTCGSCNGTKTVACGNCTEGKADCDVCGGSGSLACAYCAVDGTVERRTPCERCGETGKIIVNKTVKDTKSEPDTVNAAGLQVWKLTEEKIVRPLDPKGVPFGNIIMTPVEDGILFTLECDDADPGILESACFYVFPSGTALKDIPEDAKHAFGETVKIEDGMTVIFAVGNARSVYDKEAKLIYRMDKEAEAFFFPAA